MPLSIADMERVTARAAAAWWHTHPDAHDRAFTLAEIMDLRWTVTRSLALAAMEQT